MARFAALKADIDRELRNLERLSRELDEILSTMAEGSVIRVRAAGSVLHDFYTGAEKICRRIAVRIDQDLPTGEDWHVQLFQRVAVPAEGIRPRNGEKLETDLEQYLRSNIYGFKLEWERYRPLIENFGKVFSDLKEKIEGFKGFLDSIESGSR